MEIKGNLSGVKKSCLNEIHALAELEPTGRSFASEELCLAMLAFTYKYHRELALFLDAKGRVLEAALGDFATVGMSSFADNVKVRCIHTHPHAVASLSDADIRAARSCGFAAMSCLALDDEGQFAGASILPAGEEQPLYFGSLSRFCAYEMPVLAKRTVQEASENRALLMSLSCGRSDEEMLASLQELKSLAETAGLQTAGIYYQNALKPTAATYIGSGKVKELRMEAQLKSAEVLLFDDEISPTQLHNLELQTGLRIIDRTMLILDIFAARARSNEGKLQVELAQLKYMLPRLIGKGTQLSRLGGGIGTRGPGETKLETDRRKIYLRISELEARLVKVEKERGVRRAERISNSLPSAALVGYTNAGKTTLLNVLSGEQSFSADLLFATLDTLTRRVETPLGQAYLLSDTVGFIRRLPHQLIAAFRATLGELCYADLLLHVIDISSFEAYAQAKAVEKVIVELGVQDKPTVVVFNKCDKLCGDIQQLNSLYPHAVHISAAKGEGLEELDKAVNAAFAEIFGHCQASLVLPYSQGALLAMIHDKAEVLGCEYTEEGVALELRADRMLLDKIEAGGITVKREG